MICSKVSTRTKGKSVVVVVVVVIIAVQVKSALLFALWTTGVKKPNHILNWYRNTPYRSQLSNTFDKYIKVFGVHNFATPNYPCEKMKHAAGVMAQGPNSMENKWTWKCTWDAIWKKAKTQYVFRIRLDSLCWKVRFSQIKPQVAFFKQYFFLLNWPPAVLGQRQRRRGRRSRGPPLHGGEERRHGSL